MGWFGYGIYDGDSTFSVQTQMLELAGYKNDKLITSRNGDQSEAWDMGEDFIVNDEALANVYANYPKIIKRVGLDKLLDKNAKDFDVAVRRKPFFEEDILVPLTMVADFFMRHDAAMPGKLQERAVQATKILMSSQHTEDFDSPAKRRTALRKHLRKLETFKPKFRVRADKIVKAPVRKVAKKTVDGVKSAPAPVARRKPKP